MRFILLLLAAASLFAMSCNGSAGGHHDGYPDTVRMAPSVPRQPAASDLQGTGTTLLMSVVTKYYAVKNALVASKANNADSAAQQLVTMTGIFRRYLETDSLSHKDLLPYLDTVVIQARMISIIKDANCENQRIFFAHVSSAMYGLVKKAGLKNAGIFHEYCPMAFNEKGAFWLSDDADIKNPYFGKKMLECGEVTDSL